MHSSESELSSNDSGAGDDPHRSSSVPNSLSQLQHAYATGSDSVVPATHEKEFDEQDGQSDCSDLHSPAQPSKHQHLPSAIPYKNRQVAVSESDSDGVYRDILFDSSSSRMRGFKRLGRLSRNGPLLTTIGRLHTKK
jgi:hypothetical protein